MVILDYLTVFRKPVRIIAPNFSFAHELCPKSESIPDSLSVKATGNFIFYTVLHVIML